MSETEVPHPATKRDWLCDDPEQSPRCDQVQCRKKRKWVCIYCWHYRRAQRVWQRETSRHDRGILRFSQHPEKHWRQKAAHTLFTHFQQKRHVRPQRFRFIVTNCIAAECCWVKRIPVHPSFLLHTIVDIYCATFNTIHSIGRVGYAHRQEILGSE